MARNQSALVAHRHGDRRPAARRRGNGHLHLRKAANSVGKELRHLHVVEEKGESPLAAALVVAQVFLLLLLIVSVEVTLTFAFYFGWL